MTSHCFSLSSAFIEQNSVSQTFKHDKGRWTLGGVAEDTGQQLVSDGPHDP